MQIQMLKQTSNKTETAVMDLFTHNSNLSGADIGRILGVSRERVRQLLLRNGKKIKPHGCSVECKCRYCGQTVKRKHSELHAHAFCNSAHYAMWQKGKSRKELSINAQT